MNRSVAVGGVFFAACAILAVIAAAQGPAAGRGAGAAGASGGRGTGIAAPARGGLGGSRFKIYPPDEVARGEAAYKTTCLYCHGDHGKGGMAGPDLIRSAITMHDEDGVSYGQYLKGDVHTKAVRLDLRQNQVADIAAYIHSRVVETSGRGQVHLDMILTGDAKAGEVYFNGAGGCAKCHSPVGDLKGAGSKYDPATLQDRIVMPRGGAGRGAAATGPSPTSITATVTTPDGKTYKGLPMNYTDFDVTLRLDDGTTRTWARENGIPKVELTDPLQAHIDIMTRLKDADMHNLTAYLATLK
jgi:cytochrome c oxidase cbb3-type subunit 3